MLFAWLRLNIPSANFVHSMPTLETNLKLNSKRISEKKWHASNNFISVKAISYLNV